MVPFGFLVCFSTNTVVKPCESCTCDVLSEFMYMLFPHLSICSLFTSSTAQGGGGSFKKGKL